MSPPPLSSTPVPGDMPAPTQLKVRVHAPSANQILSLVVPLNISFHTLKDRIDAKLQRSTSLSLSAGNVKLKYVDDNDFSDEDVQIAFETWREQVGLGQQLGQLGEIELYCQR
ncbi:Guanine nucleotide exchange factor for Cdc42p [Cryomyces antarcticus]|uniref:Guanine nucleotide exchange factor for Cdc42p n=1 Tax=Cryomyces antarcticus TaxID=329879 RepID=A0ABR0M395_9PEZI|nr:Guanine nucleotide exchange factor for Cdc42p [Cryomyces antarcticus]